MLQELPTEIWNMIIGNINEKKTLRSLILVNKQFHVMTIPFLYEQVELTYINQYDSFFITMKKKPHYSEFIKIFAFELYFKISMDEKLFFLDLINTNMKRLKSLTLNSELRISFKILNGFKFNERLVELDIKSSTFEEISKNKIFFPVLKLLEVSRRGPELNLNQNLHYIAFPYIESKWFYEYINTYVSSRIFDHKQNHDILLTRYDQNPKSNFPQLISLKIGGQRYSTENVFLLFLAIVGLPSLKELYFSRINPSVDKHILESFMFLRPSPFRFTGAAGRTPVVHFKK